MQPLERLEYKSLKLLFKSNAVILYRYLVKSLLIVLSIDPDKRIFFTAVFQSIADKILKQLEHLSFNGLDYGHVFDNDRAARLQYVFFEDIRSLAGDFVKVNFLERFQSRCHPRELEQVAQKLPHSRCRIENPVEVFLSGVGGGQWASMLRHVAKSLYLA